MVKNEYGKSIKAFRIDNGGELTKKEFNAYVFNAYLFKHGIQHQKMIFYTPQQNEVVEMKNRVLVEMVRCMLYSNELHKCFSVEATCCANLSCIESLLKQF